MELHRRIASDERFLAGFAPELDIVVFAPRSSLVSESSELSRRIFDAAAGRNLHLALAELPIEFFAGAAGQLDKDRPKLTCLRSVLMKPEHREWIGRIWQALSEATDEARA